MGMDSKQSHHCTAEDKHEKKLGLQSKASKVKECSAARIKFHKDCVQKCQDVLNSWTPIFEDHQNIKSLSSGVHATENVQKRPSQNKSSWFRKVIYLYL